MWDPKKMPVLKYSMTVNNMVKNMHEASLSQIYGTQNVRLVYDSLLSPNFVATGKMLYMDV